MGTSGLVGAVVAALVLIASTWFGIRRRRTDGVLHHLDVTDAVGEPTDHGNPGEATPADAASPAPTHAALLAHLGVASGTPVTLVQFSTACCAPCRATRVLCTDVATKVSGVEHLDVDAESHLEAVRELGITRTPTLLIVDGDGRIVRRCSGLPTRADLSAAVAETLARVA